MPRKKGSAVKVDGQTVASLKHFGGNDYQTQCEGLPYGRFTAGSHEEAAEIHHAYVVRQHALKKHGDLRVRALARDYWHGEARSGTRTTYWCILGGDAPRADSFFGRFNDREITSLTLDELTPFVRCATNANGSLFSKGRRMKLRGAISKIYQEAHKRIADGGQIDPGILLPNLARHEAVKAASSNGPLHKSGAIARPRAAAAAAAVAYNVEELEAARRGVTKAASLDELRSTLLAAYERGADLYAMMLVQYCFSMRMGEVCALEKSHVDLARGTIQICGTAVYDRRSCGMRVNAVKEHRTASEEAAKPLLKIIPSRLVPVLENALNGSLAAEQRKGRWKRRQDRWLASPFLFPGTKATAPRYPSGYTTAVSKALVDAKIGRLRGTHWLRHTRATHGAAISDFKHEDPEFLKTLGRWSSISMLEVYIHETPEMMMREARQSDELLAMLLGGQMEQKTIAKRDGVVPFPVLAPNGQVAI